MAHGLVNGWKERCRCVINRHKLAGEHALESRESAAQDVIDDQLNTSSR